MTVVVSFTCLPTHCVFIFLPFGICCSHTDVFREPNFPVSQCMEANGGCFAPVNAFSLIVCLQNIVHARRLFKYTGFYVPVVASMLELTVHIPVVWPNSLFFHDWTLCHL